MLILRCCFALPAALLLFAAGPAFAAPPTLPQSHRVLVARRWPLAADTAAKPTAAARQMVSGTGLGTDGRPCVGACVFATTDTHQIAVTDRQGAFRLAVPAGPAAQLQADYFGLGSSQVVVENQPAQPVCIVIGQ